MSACYEPDHLPVPEDPARLQGPEVGALCIYTGKGSLTGQTVKVLARSYVWSPEQHRPDGYHGFRHYDWSVIAHGDGFRRHLVVDDSDLSPVE